MPPSPTEMSRPGRFLARAFSVVFFIVAAVLWLFLCFANQSSWPVATGWQLLAGALVLAGLGLAAAAGFAGRRSGRLGPLLARRPWHMAALFMAGLLCVQLWMLFSILVPTGWDPSWMMEAATAEGAHQRQDYFYAYPNNAFLLFYFRAVLKITGWLGAGPWAILAVGGVLHADIAILMMFSASKKLGGAGAGYATLLLGGLLFGLSPWLMVPYSDIYAMPWLAGVFWAFLHWRHNRGKKALGWAAAGGGLAAAGFMIKPHTAAVVLAILIVQLLWLRRGSFVQGLKSLGVAVLAALVLYGAFQFFLSRQSLIALDNSRAFPPLHFVNMGLSEDPTRDTHGTWGGYSPEAVENIQNLPNQKAMNATSLQAIKDKLAARGLPGTLAFWLQKARWVTGDGTFYWGLESGRENFAAFTAGTDNLWSRLYYPDGKNFSLYLYGAQGVWLAVLGLVVAGAFTATFGKGAAPRRAVTAAQCAVFGVLCFIMLFEGRSRYLLCALPLFALLAGLALAGLGRRLATWAGKKGQKRLQT